MHDQIEFATYPLKSSRATLLILPDAGDSGSVDSGQVGAALDAVVDAAAARRIESVVAIADGCWWSDRPGRSGRSPLEVLVDFFGERSGPAAVFGVGVGGQGALFAALERPDIFPIVAAVAPACDLGRWYPSSASLQATFETADQARQAEAPLRLNPLVRPHSFWIRCDPRDEPCAPSALRMVSKLTASGIAVDADLVSEFGVSRDAYVLAQADTMVDFIDRAVDRAPLPLLR